MCCSAAIQPRCGHEPPGGAPPEGLQVGQSISGLGAGVGAAGRESSASANQKHRHQDQCYPLKSTLTFQSHCNLRVCVSQGINSDLLIMLCPQFSLTYISDFLGDQRISIFVSVRGPWEFILNRFCIVTMLSSDHPEDCDFFFFLHIYTQKKILLKPHSY